uniref:DUF7882 family protein n=1 Tax=Agromyces humi TaxID=1766800 RepID=UPI00135AD0B8|nr:ATP-dependent DNA ligase [Agromyces humi]
MGDRALAYLQVIIVRKLRDDESFSLTLDHDDREGTVWLNARTAGEFVFSDRQMMPLNQAWLGAMALAAAMPDGLWLAPEPDLDPEFWELFDR